MRRRGGKGALFYACADPEGALHYVAPGEGCSVPSGAALPEVCGSGLAALKVRAVLRAPALTALLSGAVGELQGALGEVAPGTGDSPPTYPEADSVRRAAARSRLDQWPHSKPRLQLSFDVIVPERAQKGWRAKGLRTRSGMRMRTRSGAAQRSADLCILRIILIERSIMRKTK